jgi:hypothetical protein
VEEDAELPNENKMETDAEVYQRFLRGDDISDDEDGDDAMEGSSTLSDEEMSDDADEEKHFQEREAEVVDLFTDLIRSTDVQEGRRVPGIERGYSGSSSEIALAHLLHGSAVTSGPLTRRRWKTLTQRDNLASSNGTSGNLSFGDQQQAAELMSERYYRSVEERDKEKGLEHICVICMLESREVICWPCRYASTYLPNFL